MNVLIVGNGKGSWSIRGQQLGAAIGARVSTAPTAADWRWADLVVLVKRAARQFARVAQSAGVPIVWDALDFWQQPADNARDSAGALKLLQIHLNEIRPVLTIGATAAMAEAAGGACLPHHSWPGLSPAAVRPRVQAVAYEGNAIYLGRWRAVLEQACARRGWRFEVNPKDLRAADIVVAVRDAQWDGWICREWKSGVKVVNAMAAGRPLITQPSAAFREIGHAGTEIERFDAIDAALDEWSPEEARTAALDHSNARIAEFSLAAVAATYSEMLARAEARCAA